MPLNTDNIQIKAAVASTIPHTDIVEITLMALCDFLENRYRLAMWNDKFKIEYRECFFTPRLFCLCSKACQSFQDSQVIRLAEMQVQE